MHKAHTNISDRAAAGKAVYRGRIEMLRSRANMLSGTDKVLMTMYLEKGNSIRQMARLAGVSEAAIARRIRRITKRLTRGKYITCLRNRDKFTERQMAVAKDHFLLGHTFKSIAERHNLSLYRVRQTVRRIKQIVRSIEDSSRAPGRARPLRARTAGTSSQRPANKARFIEVR